MIQTKNLLITPFESNYAAKIKEWWSDPAYENYFRHHIRVYKDADFINYPSTMNGEILMILNKSDNEIIGMIQLNADSKTNRAVYLGLLIDKNYQGRRYPQESFIAILDYCFYKLNFQKAIVESLASHTRLITILDSTNFRKEGHLKHECFVNGHYVDEVRYAMFADEFPNIVRELRG